MAPQLDGAPLEVGTMPKQPVAAIAAAASRIWRKRGDGAAASEYSARLAVLARFTLRHKAVVVGGWIAVAVVLALLFPQLETVVRKQSVDLIPRDVPSFQTVDRMSGAFGEQGSKTMLFIAMEDPAGLTLSTRQRYDQLVTRLRADTRHVLLVQDLLADSVTAPHAVSKDHKAWYLPVGVAGTLGDPAAAESVHAVTRIAADAFNGSTTTVRVTGPPATFSDQVTAGEHDMLLISIATSGLIALILLTCTARCSPRYCRCWSSG
jgi:putative drug exporter of the RND superfamily